MKRLKILLIFLLFTTGYTQAQWEIQLDNENFTHLDRIFFLNDTLGWAIGGATIGSASPYFYTTNGGEQWYLDDDWMNIAGTDIVFVNQDTGFIAAANGIIKKTVNGGQTWTDIQTPATQNVMYLFFVDENNGWATLYNSGDILHSVNGGDNWEIVTTSLSYISDLFIVENTIWCSGWTYSKTVTSSIIKSIDYGLTWEEKHLGGNNFFYSLYFINSNIGWTGGQLDLNNDTPYIMKTINSGNTWEEQLIEYVYETKKVNCIFFIDDTTGWLGVGESQSQDNYGAIYFTNNGGVTWQLQQEFYKPVIDIQMLNKDHGWIVGGDYIYYTSNGTFIPANIDEHKNNHIIIQPNPSNGIFIVKNLQAFAEPCSVSITDITGKTIINYQLKNINCQHTINVSYLQPGIYFLKLSMDNDVIQTKKLIIQ